MNDADDIAQKKTGGTVVLISQYSRRNDVCRSHDTTLIRLELKALQQGLMVLFPCPWIYQLELKLQIADRSICADDPTISGQEPWRFDATKHPRG